MTSSPRWRIIAFASFVLLCVGGVMAYVTWRPAAMRSPTSGSDSTLDPRDPEVAAALDASRRGAHLVFLNSQLDALGLIAVTSADGTATRQVYQSPLCERAYFSKTIGLCLELNRDSSQPRAFAHLLDPHFQTIAKLPLIGLPIRARISPDGRHGAATVFVTGENYASEDFTTRTTIFDLAARTALVDLEQFTVERDGKPFRAVDFNFWGVTFRGDGNTFLATLGTGGQRLLVDGDLSARRFRVVATDVECPSLSPDQRTIVFKRQKTKGSWQLWAMDLNTRDAWPITEDGQDVDDQVEWLDADHVLYGMVSGNGNIENQLSLWTTDARRDAGKNQRLFLKSGWSPSAIR